jgi:CHASE1-domain containing sensor protein
MDAIADSKQTAKDVLSMISRSAMWFLFFGLMVVIFSSGWDIMFGSAITHPIWQSNYNWMPLVEDIFIVSVSGGAMLGIMPQLLHAYRRQTNEVKKTILLTPLLPSQSE